jgi:serine/threonine protein kinase
VGECHKRGVVHGDVKPENIKNTPDKSRTTLLDFGTASICAGVHIM